MKESAVKADIELRHLRVFVTLVEVGAHARAARALGISQSTVSETMSALERTLGTALFRRGPKGPLLTPAGEATLPYARRMLALANELVTELTKASADVSATLVVSTVESISAYVLPARLAALRARWPKVRLEVTTGSCPEIRERVAAGKSDLGLVLEGETAAADEPVLARGRLLIVGSPGHPLANHQPSADDLRRCEFYMCDAGGNYNQVLRQHFEAAQVPAPRTQALGSIEGLKRGVLGGGDALGLLPAHAVEQELRDGRLAEISVSPALPPLVLRSVVAPGSPGSPVVDALLGLLRDSLVGAPPAPT
jgi:DNA-binding transcriptional LysR family regulator